MTAQAAARAREMALRVSIGAGRWRLVQLVLVESACSRSSPRRIGGLFAWWSAPFVVSRINPPDNPARLSLPADWRVLGFGLALTLGVTLLFGLAPALRASSVKPGERAQRRRRSALAPPPDACADRRAGGLLFSGAFRRRACSSPPSTGCRISPRASPPNGFSLSIRWRSAPQPPVFWDQVAEHLRTRARRRSGRACRMAAAQRRMAGTASSRSTARLPARSWLTF